MESSLLGLVADSSVLVAAERENLTTPEVIRRLEKAIGDVPLVISALTVAELGHGIYRADTAARAQQRRRFLDDLKRRVLIHPVTAATAEIIARVGGEQSRKGVTVPLADLIIGACALELGYALGARNLKHFQLIPGLDVRGL